MENFEGQQSEGLEEQVRRMILSNGQMQMNPANATLPIPPTGRLPPPASSQDQKQSSPAPYQHQPPPYQGGRNTSPAVAQQPSLFPHPNQSGPGFPHARYQNGRQQPSYPQNQRNFQDIEQPPRQFNNRRHPHAPPGQFQRGRYQQQMQLDPNAFHRNNFGPPRQHQGQQQQQQQLFNPHGASQKPMAPAHTDQHDRQSQYLDHLAAIEIRNVEMSPAEHGEKEAFRLALEKICHQVCDSNPTRLPKVNLECFGSFKSGFATAGSDMDLVIVGRDLVLARGENASCFSVFEDDLPRVLEKRLLQLGYGARLLTRTRVPILKVCEKPSVSFLDKLREEREKWDALPEEGKYPHLYQKEEEAVVEPDEIARGANEEQGSIVSPVEGDHDVSALQNGTAERIVESTVNGGPHTNDSSNGTKTSPPTSPTGSRSQNQQIDTKPWMREKKAGPLDFPKSGVGIQSDINFSNPLGLHNTQLLRCYSLCDPRVRPIVLFVKAWAKRRKINSSYSGTLSSYGYVLMVLHYLVNVAQPPVLPNLQGRWRPRGVPPANEADAEIVDGWTVNFWRNEAEITTAAHRNLLTSNRETLGSLLAGFFTYFSSLGGGRQFRWMQEVLSLRSIGGLLTKEEKGWVKAVTEEGEGRKIQHRYLFCIEDPFELEHNVARTVTHKGIVAVRDEFRRARRILQGVGMGMVAKEGELFAPLVEVEEPTTTTGEVRVNGGQRSAGNSVDDGAGKSTPAMQNGGAQKTPPINQRRNNYMNGKPHSPTAHGIYRSTQPLRHPPQTLPPKFRAFDVQDNEAFPSLSGGKPAKRRAGRPLPQNDEDKEEFSEISGEQAQAFLQEVKRKKDEAQAEVTATGAAEAVLEGID